LSIARKKYTLEKVSRERIVLKSCASFLSISSLDLKANTTEI
jgi:hypothetical protein